MKEISEDVLFFCSWMTGTKQLVANVTRGRFSGKSPFSMVYLKYGRRGKFENVGLKVIFKLMVL